MEFNLYASFNILVTEDEFPINNRIGVWPNGCPVNPLRSSPYFSPSIKWYNIPILVGQDSCHLPFKKVSSTMVNNYRFISLIYPQLFILFLNILHHFQHDLRKHSSTLTSLVT
jgi:hypothetical protein